MIKYLSWAFCGRAGVLVDNNFTLKALFLSRNFGEGIDDNNPIKTNPSTVVKKRDRWGTNLRLSEVLASFLSLIVATVTSILVSLLSEQIAPRIPTSFIVAFSIGVGVITIGYIAVEQFRLQAKIKLLAIEKLKIVESDFFDTVENEISALFSERVG